MKYYAQAHECQGVAAKTLHNAEGALVLSC